MFDRRKKSRRSFRNQPSLQYGSLEDRKLLAVTATFSDVSGLVIQSTDAADVIRLDNVGGEVQFNQNFIDSDPTIDGVQRLLVEELFALNVLGTNGGGTLTLNDDFNSGALQSVFVERIETVAIEGNYSVVGDFRSRFDIDGGSLSGPGSLTVDRLFVNSNGAANVSLLNPDNDFRVVNFTTSGDVSIVDSNRVTLREVDVANLTVTASSTIRDLVNSSIAVSELTSLTAMNVELGTRGGTADLFSLRVTADQFALFEQNSIGWRLDSTIGNATIFANGNVSMGPNAILSITGDVIFDVNALYANTGTFNSGRLSVNALRADIIESSSVEFFERSEVTGDLTLEAAGDIFSSVGSEIRVNGIASFATPENISLGASGGTFILFSDLNFTGNNVVFQSTSLSLVGDNTAENLELSSEFIRNEDNSSLVVAGNSTFLSEFISPFSDNSVEIGNAENDFFTSGTISFRVQGFLGISEDDGTIIASPNGFVNLAIVAELNSVGDLINAPDSIIRVDSTANLTGANIAIGQANANDEVFVSSVSLNTPGNATLAVNTGVSLSGDSVIGGDALLVANGQVRDSTRTNFTVVGQLQVFGSTINLGDTRPPIDTDAGGDFFQVGSLRFGSPGDVSIVHDGDVVLLGNTIHRSDTLRLTSINGSISNLAGANLRVFGNLSLAASSDITLGSDPTDVIQFDNLNFRSSSAVTINAVFDDPRDRIFIFGRGVNRSTASELRLTTNVDVLDGRNAVIEVQDFLSIDARNIRLGNTETDCLSIPENSVFDTEQGQPDVTPNQFC